MTRHAQLSIVLIGALVALAACGGDDPVPATTSTHTNVLRVPDDYPTIQAGVDAAEPGSLVLVGPGVYHESLSVTTDDLVIRGLSRATTVLDGEFELDTGVRVEADDVVVENMTARRYTANAFIWTGVDGYRGSYLNALQNGNYGLYAFDSVRGQFDHSYAAGNVDGGIYIGQCSPCDAVVTDIVSEWNGMGYEGTNASGDLFVMNSVWQDNRVGVVPNSSTGEEDSPQRGATFAGNIVRSNNNTAAPGHSIGELLTGNGIVIAGGNDNVVLRNLVEDHNGVGIAITPFPEVEIYPSAVPNRQNFTAADNRVVENVVRDSRGADLALVASLDDPGEPEGNCFSRNDFATSRPAAIETVVACDTPVAVFTADDAWLRSILAAEPQQSPQYDEVTLPSPGNQPEMPDPETAPRGPTTRMRIDLDTITLPSTRE